MGSHSLHCKVLVVFLLPLMLWGCGNEMMAPVKTIAIKVATTYCESNSGVEWIKARYEGQKATDYKVSFRCKNGLQSDWQTMTEEANKELVK